MPKENTLQLKLSDLKFDDFQKDALKRNGVVNDSIIYVEQSPRTMNKRQAFYLIDSFDSEGNKKFYREHALMGGHYRYEYDKHALLVSKSGGSCLFERYQFYYFFFPEKGVLCQVQFLNGRPNNSITIFSFQKNGRLHSSVDYAWESGSGSITFYQYNTDGVVSEIWEKAIVLNNSLRYQEMNDNLYSVISSKKKYYYHGIHLDSNVTQNQMFNNPNRYIFSRQYFDPRGLTTREFLFERVVVNHNYTIRKK